MSEMEIKHLTDLQARIKDFSKTLANVNISISLYAFNHAIPDYYCPPQLYEKAKRLIAEEYDNEIARMREERDQLVICTSTTKTSYKPIDILDNE